jgi:hypothetical protein
MLKLSAIGAGRASSPGGRSVGGSRSAAPLAAIAVALAVSASGLTLTATAAGAVSPPTVSTGAAREVSYGSAVLTGSVDPNGRDASYYFQYGVTKAYGGQTAIADAGSGVHSVSVRLPVSGLQPITVYHYRLVAVSSAGATIGGDATLLTTKVPLSLQILASPNPVVFGGPITVQGTLSGTGNGNRVVILQANTFPFTAGFQNLGNPLVTNAAGGFSFPVLGMTLVTQFRVVTTTNPPVASPVAVESVAVGVASHVGRTSRAHFARIFGTVTPAENGMEVGILRITHGRGVLVGGTRLHPRNASSSKFSRVVPVRPGVYRVLVRVTSGAQISSYGGPLLIR